MTSAFLPDPDAPFFQCPTPACVPSLVTHVDPCPAPEVELFYVATSLVGETLYRWYRLAFVPEGHAIEFWAQVRESDPEAA